MTSVCEFRRSNEEDKMLARPEMQSYLTLTANWNMGDSIDPKQETYEFGLDTYDSSMIVTAALSKAAWEGMGCPTALYLRASL